MGFFTEVDNTYAKCNICRNTFSYKTSTSNLKRHMEKKHPSISIKETGNSTMESVQESNKADSQVVKEAVIDNTSTASTSNSDNKELEPHCSSATVVPKSIRPRQTVMSTFIHTRVTPKLKQDIDQKLLRLFTASYQPFRIVEERAFREFVTALNPTYELPSRHTISKTLLPAMYEKCLHDTREVLRKAKKLTVTTDFWTSVNMESFMAVTVHFLDDDFNLISLLLDCSSLPVQHTSVNLAKEIKRILAEWNVENKVLMVVSDNAANIKGAVKNELRWKHFGCLAHTINLVANDGLKQEEISRIINKVKQIVNHFKRSHIATSRLLTYQRNQGNENPLKILQDVSTRWNSTFYMLERFVRLDEAIKATMALINIDQNYNLTQDEWEVVRQLCEIFKPLEEVTKMISGEAYLTCSLVIYILSISTFLDPRFKQIPFRDEKNVEIVKKNVISLVAEKFSAEESSTPELDKSANLSIDSTANNQNSESDIWAKFDKTAAQFQTRGISTSRAIIEMQRFLESDRLDRSGNSLNWWRKNKYIFPHLAIVAQERLSAIATSVPCERLFSKAGLIVSDRRNRLSSNKTRMLLLLNSNCSH